MAYDHRSDPDGIGADADYHADRDREHEFSVSASVRQMDSREFVRGLMRGNRAEFQLGYDPDSAVLTAVKVQGLSDANALNLRAYAHGFAAGMREDAQKTNPG